MRFEGRMFKDGEHWLIEIPALGAMTQGHDRKEALEMVQDLVETMANRDGFEVTVYPTGEESIEIDSSDVRTLTALFLRRQREQRGLTLAQVAERLNQKSLNAYARYEQGRSIPTVEKLEELLGAIAPEERWIWRLAKADS